MAGPETLQWPRSLEGAEVSTIDATPRDEGELGEDHSECTAISDCSQELSRRINPVTASPNAVSKPAKRNTTNARGPCSPGFGRPANAKQVCGVTRLLWVRAPRSVRRRPNDRSSGPLSSPALAKSAGFRSTLRGDSFRCHHPNATTARPDVDLPTHSGSSQPT
jgi:hypothetical protein